MKKAESILAGALIFAVVALCIGAFLSYCVDDARAFTGSVEYKELTSTGPSSTSGTLFQGDVLACVWNTAGADPFTGTVKIQLYHSLGPTGSKGMWVDTGDQFTAAGCKVLEVPENGVKLRMYATLSSGSVRIRLSQEYPTKINNVGR
jgi:hypothetical protein